MQPVISFGSNNRSCDAIPITDVNGNDRGWNSSNHRGPRLRYLPRSTRGLSCVWHLLSAKYVWLFSHAWELLRRNRIPRHSWVIHVEHKRFLLPSLSKLAFGRQTLLYNVKSDRNKDPLCWKSTRLLGEDRIRVFDSRSRKGEASRKYRVEAIVCMKRNTLGANARLYIIYSEPLSSALRQVSHLRTALALCRGFDDGKSREEILRDVYTVHPFHTVNRRQLYFPSLLTAGGGAEEGEPYS